MHKKVIIYSIIIISITYIHANSWPIPDTGQTKCYDNEKEISCPKPGEPFYGQDGNYNINPPSYTKLDENGDELPDNATTWVMVRDNVTGLIWEIKTASDGVKNYTNPHDADNVYTWYDSNPETNGGHAGTKAEGTDTEDFINALNDEAFGGYTDWRIPEINEFFSICYPHSINPFIRQLFPNTQYNANILYYWSSNTTSSDQNKVWVNNFYDGLVSFKKKDAVLFVKAVRCPVAKLNRWVVNSDSTITDILTGLMWEQETTLSKTWSEALSICENSNFNGFSDWRLPSFGELYSIVSYKKYNPAIDGHIFLNSISDKYWSSNSLIYVRHGAWCIDFNNGGTLSQTKTYKNNLRAVRGGQNIQFGHLTILYPKQASNWETGNSMHIQWDTKDIPGNVEITLSRHSGKPKTYEMIALNTPNDGEFYWQVSGPGSVNCMLKITPLKTPDKFAQQGLFMITEFVSKNLISDSHTINTCHNDKTIDIKWSAPEVWGRKVDGYSITWDHSPETLPDKEIITKELIYTSPTLDEGNDHYVHIRVVDDQGHWSNIATHLGPFCISNVPTPQGLTVIQQTSEGIKLQWYLMAKNLSYNVYRSESEQGFYIKCDPYEISTPEFRDTDIRHNQIYWYKVSALDHQGIESPLSQAVMARVAHLSAGGFKLIAQQNQQTQIPGLTTTYSIMIEQINNYTHDIQLNVVNLNSGIIAEFEKQTLTPPGFVNLLITPVTLPAGRYPFKVLGLGFNWSDEIDLSLDVTIPEPDDSAISLYVHSDKNYRMDVPFSIYGSILPQGDHLPLTIYVQHEDSTHIIPTKTRYDRLYEVLYTPDETGLYTLFARWDGDEYVNASQSSILQVNVIRGFSDLTCQTPDKELQENANVRITGCLTPSQEREMIVLQTTNPDGLHKKITNRIFTDTNGNYQYTIPLNMDGIWEIRACWKGNDAYKGIASQPLRLYPGLKAGKNLIIAGGGLDDPHWGTFNYLSKRFYRILLDRQCTKDMIHFISSDTDTAIINDTTPQTTDIQNWMASLYQNNDFPDVNPDRPLLIYMVDHGSQQKIFKVNKNREHLTSGELDKWLDDLQSQTQCPVYLILDFCFSGLFGADLMPDPDQKRIIITSTKDNYAIYDKDGRQSFSNYLFNALSQGLSLGASFDAAGEDLDDMNIFQNQIPQLFDGYAGELAQITYIGGSFHIGTTLPEIIDHTKEQTIDAGTFDLFVTIDAISGIEKVWATVMFPNYYIPKSEQSFDTPVIDLPTIDLHKSGDGRYEGIYTKFEINGIYRVTFFCEDSNDNVISKEIMLNVTGGRTIISGDLDGNGQIQLTDAILSMQTLSGMSISVDEPGRILCDRFPGTCEVIEILQVMAGVK